MKRVVDRQGFDRIDCGRCGQCCEEIWLNSDTKGRHTGPLGLLELYGAMQAAGSKDDSFTPRGFMEYSGQLVPRWDEASRCWLYTCGHFSRDEEGLGVCGIYERRPKMCADFPSGKPVGSYDECTFNVSMVDFEVVS